LSPSVLSYNFLRISSSVRGVGLGLDEGTSLGFKLGDVLGILDGLDASLGLELGDKLGGQETTGIQG
jgi:hypothetical protein